MRNYFEGRKNDVLQPCDEQNSIIERQVSETTCNIQFRLENEKKEEEVFKKADVEVVEEAVAKATEDKADVELVEEAVEEVIEEDVVKEVAKEAPKEVVKNVFAFVEGKMLEKVAEEAVKGKTSEEVVEELEAEPTEKAAMEILLVGEGKPEKSAFVNRKKQKQK